PIQFLRFSQIPVLFQDSPEAVCNVPHDVFRSRLLSGTVLQDHENLLPRHLSPCAHTYLSTHNFLLLLPPGGCLELSRCVPIPDTAGGHVPVRCGLSGGIIPLSAHILLSVQPAQKRCIYFLPGFPLRMLPEDSFLSLFRHTEKFLPPVFPQIGRAHV